MALRLFLVLSLLSTLNSAAIDGEGRVNAGLNFDFQVCSNPGNCVTESAKLVVDYRWTGCADPRNCNNVSSVSKNGKYMYDFRVHGFDMKIYNCLDSRSR